MRGGGWPPLDNSCRGFRRANQRAAIRCFWFADAHCAREMHHTRINGAASVISLKDLEFLSSLARHRHFARAAEDCGVSQPAFSMRIRKLEERLDSAIVKRGNRFQGFTPAGEALLRHGRKIMDNMKLLEEEFRSAGGDVTGQLALGVVPTAVAYAAGVVQRLRHGNPGITVRLQAASSLAIQQGLENGLYDAGITYGEGVSPDLMRVEHLYDERYLLLAPAALAPRANGKATWAEAAELPLALLEPGMQNRRILDLVFREVGMVPDVIAETGEFTSAMVMAANGMAATVVPEGLAEAFGKNAGLVALELEAPVVEKDVSLVSAHRHPGLSTVEALRRTLDLSDFA
ncbi:Hydrogen peroxide-inducible genes activator [Shimia sp. SK013]|nr:Hydrogen peroxide-inducible genes activator [Shimia sp. SK013]